MPILVAFPFTVQGKEPSLLTESIIPKQFNKMQDQLQLALLRMSRNELDCDRWE